MTIDRVNLTDVKEDSPIRELVATLNCKTNYNEDDPSDSIMHYGQLCDHDDGYLCEHRLQFIIDTLKKQGL